MPPGNSRYRAGVRRAQKEQRRLQRLVKRKQRNRELRPVKPIERKVPVLSFPEQQIPPRSTSRWKRGVKRVLVSLLILHAMSHVGVFVNSTYHRFNPSFIRQQFQRQFNTRVNSWRADFEETPKNISTFAEAMDQEWRSAPSSLSSLRVIPEEYWKRTSFEKLLPLGASRGGFYNSIVDCAAISSTPSNITIRHEMKHHKTFEVLRRHPEFKRKWCNLAIGANGKSMYVPLPVEIATRIRFVDKLANKWHANNPPSKGGFVSEYARTNMYEDIAEFCEKMESIHSGADWKYKLVYGRNKDPRIQAKLRLAIRYGLISPAVTDFIRLEGFRSNLFEPSVPTMVDVSELPPSIPNVRNFNRFMKETNRFVRKHANSMYVCKVLVERAGAFQTIGRNPESIEECFRALDAPFKDYYSYSLALRMLRTMFEQSRDPRATVMSQAIELYQSRQESGDILISRVGVNDFLREKGLL